MYGVNLQSARTARTTATVIRIPKQRRTDGQDRSLKEDGGTYLHGKVRLEVCRVRRYSSILKPSARHDQPHQGSNTCIPSTPKTRRFSLYNSQSRNLRNLLLPSHTSLRRHLYGDLSNSLHFLQRSASIHRVAKMPADLKRRTHRDVSGSDNE